MQFAAQWTIPELGRVFWSKPLTQSFIRLILFMRINQSQRDIWNVLNCAHLKIKEILHNQRSPGVCVRVLQQGACVSAGALVLQLV